MFKKAQIKFLKMEITVSDIKNTLNIIKSRLDTVENINELESIAMETH